MKSFKIDFTGKTGADFITEGVAKSFKFGNYYGYFVVANETDPMHEGLAGVPIPVVATADAAELAGVASDHITDDTHYEWVGSGVVDGVLTVRSEANEVADVDTGLSFPD